VSGKSVCKTRKRRILTDKWTDRQIEDAYKPVSGRVKERQRVRERERQEERRRK